VKEWIKETGAIRGEDRVGQGKREGRKPSRGRKRQIGKGRQMGKEKLLRVQTQACNIQPLRMGRNHTA